MYRSGILKVTVKDKLSGALKNEAITTSSQPEPTMPAVDDFDQDLHICIPLTNKQIWLLRLCPSLNEPTRAQPSQVHLSLSSAQSFGLCCTLLQVGSMEASALINIDNKLFTVQLQKLCMHEIHAGAQAVIVTAETRNIAQTSQVLKLIEVITLSFAQYQATDVTDMIRNDVI
jgi:hypothetical protein